MFFKGVPESYWPSCLGLISDRRAPDGSMQATLHCEGGWGVCVELLVEGMPLQLFCTAPEVERFLKVCFQSPAGLADFPKSWLDLAMQLRLSPFLRLFPSKAIEWGVAYPMHLEEAYRPTVRWIEGEGKPEAPDFPPLQFQLLRFDAAWFDHWIEGWELGENPSFTWPFWVEIGRTQWPRAQLPKLQPGTAVALEEAEEDPKRQAGWLSWGERLATLYFSEGSLKWGEKLMSLDPKEGLQNPAAPIWNESYITLTACVGQLSSNLATLARLEKGEVIKEGLTLFPKVRLVAEGRCLAQGKLFRVEERWFVKIEALRPEESGHAAWEATPSTQPVQQERLEEAALEV